MSCFVLSNCDASTRHLAFSFVVFADVTGKLEDTLPHEHDLDGTCTLQLYRGLLDILKERNIFSSMTSQEIASKVWRLANLHAEEKGQWDSEGHHDDELRAAKQLALHVAAASCVGIGLFKIEH